MAAEQCVQHDESDDGELLTVAAVLVLIQAAIALVTSVGFFVWGIGAGLLPVLLPSAALEAGKPVLLVVLATGILRGRRWARRWAVGYQSVALVVLALNLLLGLLPVVQVGVSLVMLVTGAALPIALLAILMSPRAYRATELAHPLAGAAGRYGGRARGRQRTAPPVAGVSTVAAGGE